MEFKTGDKVKIISLDNTFAFHFNKELILNKILTVRSTFTLFDSQFVKFIEDFTFMNAKDLILLNSNLEIE